MCVNRPSAPLHEDEGVMTPKLPTEQVVDGNRKFLTSMILLYIYISTSVLIVVSYIEPQRASKRYVLIGHLLHYTKMVSWLLDYLQNIWRLNFAMTINKAQGQTTPMLVSSYLMQCSLTVSYMWPSLGLPQNKMSRF
jgi:hypothetical protein